MSVSCECCLLSGRGLCDELVPRPEESYRLWCVWVWWWSLEKLRRPRPPRGCRAIEKKKWMSSEICHNREANYRSNVFFLLWLLVHEPSYASDNGTTRDVEMQVKVYTRSGRPVPNTVKRIKGNFYLSSFKIIRKKLQRTLYFHRLVRVFNYFIRLYIIYQDKLLFIFFFFMCVFSDEAFNYLDCVCIACNVYSV
jgi:hypothetical protein